MKPLILLLIAFGISAIFSRIPFAGNVAMCAMFCFTALGHFKFHRGMVKMMPGFVPFKEAVVYVSGVAEILLGAGLLFPVTREGSAIALLAFLAFVLPANINAARKRVNYETGGADGPGLRYLWFRVPAQVFYMAWLIYFGIRH